MAKMIVWQDELVARCRSADYIHFELINFPRLKEVTVVAALADAIAVASATCCTFEISFAEM